MLILRSMNSCFLRCSFFFKDKEIEVTFIGLENAGKTSIINAIVCAPRLAYVEDMISTVGFNLHKVTRTNVRLKLWDLGGQPRFRSMWERYCRAVSVIAYVVDAADHDNISLSRSELHNLLRNASLSGIPLLVLGNKFDNPEALSEDALMGRMDMKSVTERGMLLYDFLQEPDKH